MTISSFVQVLESPALSKLLVLACVAVPFFYLRRKDTEGQFTGYLVLVGLLAARDLVSAFVNLPVLIPLSDVLALAVISVIFMGPRRGLRLPLFAILVADLALLALLVLGTAAPELAFLPPWALPVAILVQATLTCLLSARVREEDGEVPQAHLIARLWPWTLGFLAAYAVSMAIFGADSALVARFFAPLSYGWLVAAALIAMSMQDREMVDAVSYYEGSVDSLYNLFLATGTVLKGSFSTEDVVKSMNDTMVSETGADGGVIFLVDEFDDLITCKAYAGVYPPPVPLPESLPRKANRVESYMKHAQFKLGETIFGEVAKTGKNVYITDASADPRVARNGDEDFLRLSSLMVLPLMVEDKIIGVASVAKTGAGQQFNEADYDKFKLLANFGTLAVSNFFSFLEANERSGLQQSADIAAEIQRTIVPKKLPQFPLFALGSFSSPALGVSGDYYDVMQTRKDRLVCVVGDVAGKGVSAALIMVMIRSILHLITNTDRDIATVLDWVNRGITGQIDMDHYATLGIVALNLETGDMEYANANHQPLMIYRKATNEVELVELKSVPIGVERGSTYQRLSLKLGDGDIVALYTDGVVEALNESGKQFGRKNLSQALIKYRDLAPKEITNKIKNDLEVFSGSVRQHDDQTVLVLKMKR